MRIDHTIKVLMLVLAGILIFTVALSKQPAKAATTYEYKVDPLPETSTGLQEGLNKLAAQGWELVTVAPAGAPNRPQIISKRQR